ncbi:DNA binding protein [Acinetobacter phage Acj9]|uniref:Uncharacterized protein n=1 Tax=Acinetobacter phage Acj9 TaxID=760939 RepID=E5EPN0_9CAUD|nr:DNA binding protein [Acinetobacter phage Acj9]ADG59996.1 conserved hypothetical protein [Acinetobacter phage Acj9]
MNIFIFDECVVRNAQYHGNKHVVKMITEYNQLLSTACHVHGLDTTGMYKKTHVHHPSAQWVRESRANFEYLLDLNISLLQEYTHRYGKVHAGSRLIDLFIDQIENVPVGSGERTDFVAVLPGEPVDRTKTDSAVVRAYRNLYMNQKRNLAEWKNREVPYWFK